MLALTPTQLVIDSPMIFGWVYISLTAYCPTACCRLSTLQFVTPFLLLSLLLRLYYPFLPLPASSDEAVDSLQVFNLPFN